MTKPDATEWTTFLERVDQFVKTMDKCVTITDSIASAMTKSDAKTARSVSGTY